MSTVGTICNVLGWVKRKISKFLQKGKLQSRKLTKSPSVHHFPFFMLVDVDIHVLVSVSAVNLLIGT